MNWRKRDKLIEAMVNNKDLYIVNTGVKISVEYFGSSDNRDYRGRIITAPVKIEFLTSPTSKALKLCKNFQIRKNGMTKKMELAAEIDLNNLSLTPYEGKIAKLVYTDKGK